MKHPRRPVSSPIQEGKQQPVALFKTSLRDWQSRYQPRGAILAGVSGKVPSRIAPA
jgi:hypothetical protein